MSETKQPMDKERAETMETKTGHMDAWADIAPETASVAEPAAKAAKGPSSRSKTKPASRTPRGTDGRKPAAPRRGKAAGKPKFRSQDHSDPLISA